MATMKLGRAELWFCAADTPAVDEAHTWQLKEDAGTILVRVAPSRLPPLQDGRLAYEVFVQHTNGRGQSAVLRREGTLYWNDDERADEMQWRLAIGGKYLGRTTRVWLPERVGCFGVSLKNTGESAIVDAGEGGVHYGGTQFFWGEGVSSDHFNWWPQDEFDRHFLQQFEDEDSPFRRAYEWHGWSENERTVHVLGCENGTWAEMKSLAECVLVLSFEPEGEEPFWDVDVWDVLEEENNDPFRFHKEFQGEQEWAQTLRRVFLPRILRDDAPLYERNHLQTLFLRVYPQHLRSQPTAHEKAEAFLQLRDWAQRNVPDDAARLLALLNSNPA